VEGITPFSNQQPPIANLEHPSAISLSITVKPRRISRCNHCEAVLIKILQMDVPNRRSASA